MDKSFEPPVAVRHGVVHFGDRAVLHGVDLRVEAGQAVALLGANGSGKSTLIKSALGLVRLSEGTASLFGTPVRRFRKWHRVGYVPQRLGAGSGVPASVREVVAAGRLSRRTIGLPARKRDKAVIEAALEAVGLADRAKDPVGTLSGGQQQRTLIARALAAQPELLVLDEPTAGVDAASQEALAAVLADRVADGATVLLVAHELGPLAPLIDRAVVLSHGEIVHDGPVPEPAGVHADPGHVHVHPHAKEEERLWT
ncbi:metal ABC transporter ATP-binding protein [Phytomonospora sp. NPDC050363]|uniref:metal ABC transporter ATP-binding protein n=1 Tax=Phytomonospora sp. NPDC050363 TaxID=3155642 RepID=UPI00340CDB7C